MNKEKSFRMSNLIEENKSLKFQNAVLKQRVHDLELAVKDYQKKEILYIRENERLNLECKNLRFEHKKLKRENRFLRNRVSILENQVEHLQKEVEILKVDLIAERELSKSVQVKHDALQIKYDDLQVEHDDLKVKHDVLRVQHEVLRVQHDDLQVRYEALERKWNARDAHIRIRQCVVTFRSAFARYAWSDKFVKLYAKKTAYKTSVDDVLCSGDSSKIEEIDAIVRYFGLYSVYDDEFSCMLFDLCKDGNGTAHPDFDENETRRAIDYLEQFDAKNVTDMRKLLDVVIEIGKKIDLVV